MAARLNNRQSEQSRAAIQTTQLIKRLQEQAFGTVELSQQQIKAIEILLKKSLPDLSAVELSTDPDNPIDFKWTVEVVSAKTSDT